MLTFLEHVDRLPAADRKAILGKIPESLRSAVRAAGLLGWLPIDLNLACTRAVAECLGEQRTHDFFRSLLLDTSDTPLLRGLVQSVLRVAVRDPGLYLPWISKGFELMFRDSGRFTVTDRGIGTARIEATSLPQECLVDDVWPKSVASALCALQDLTGLEGMCVLERVDAETGTMIVRATWKARGR
jgi:hypothetical protein